MTTASCAALVIALGLWSTACGDDAAPSAADRGPALECPSGLAPDAARARRVYDRLRSAPEGAAALAALGEDEPPICFGDAEPSVVTSEGVLWLDGRMADAEAAARVGHLLHHLAAMPDLDHPRPGTGCDALVSQAMRVERESVALEHRLRRVLGVTAPVTDPRTDGLEASYRRRCELAGR